MRLIISLVLLPSLAFASWWDDFSNNLASDLAPILALFGEQVTKQFLSESTTGFDSFIFAMVPLGILTAVVSVIRVCGGPSLRAFVGRAQESSGVAEAELCSSTSRDVCEVYRQGAFVRVFGQPTILELVHDPHDAEFYDLGDDKADCGIHLFRDYIGSTPAEMAGWTENGRPVATMREKEYNANMMRFAPSPNLSLNYSIKKHTDFVFWAAALAGFILQSSILWFAALAAYRWHWKKNDSLVPVWAFPMMVFGTVLQCVGMWLCAYLIDASTKERVFRKNGIDKEQRRACLFVVQPGNQVIGDQVLDSFSYRDSLHHGREYITSWKDGQQRPRPATAAGSVGVTMIGFVLQFVSLRAMHSAISVFQLAAILLMSLVRSTLRTQRFNAEQNLLWRCPDEVQGHELDWLALEMEETQNNDKSNLPTVPLSEDEGVTGQNIHPNPGNSLKDPPSKQLIDIIESDSSGMGPVCAIMPSKAAGFVTRLEQRIQDMHVKWLRVQECSRGSIVPDRAARLLYMRARLARLTNQPQRVPSAPSMAWSERLVRGKSHARQLKTAIETSADAIFSLANVKPSWKDAHLLSWSFSNLSWLWTVDDWSPEPWTHMSIARHLTHDTLSGWDIDQNILEAAIGLSTWTLISNPNAQMQDEFGNTVSIAEQVPNARVLALANKLIPLGQIYKIMRSWIPEFQLKVTCVRWPRATLLNSPKRSPAVIWYPGVDTLVHSTTFQLESHEYKRLNRFAGLQALKPADIPNRSVCFGLTAGTHHSLATLCAHEIYHSFIYGVTEAIESIGGTVTSHAGGLEFSVNNDVISKLVECFERSGLGSRQDAYLIIVSALYNQGKLQLAMEDIKSIVAAAENHKKKKEFEQAEAILKWAWDSMLKMQAGVVRDSTLEGLAEIAMALGELYRLFLFSCNETMAEFAQNGFSWMSAQPARLEGLNPSPADANEILSRYLSLLRQEDDDEIPSAEDVMNSMSSGDKDQTLRLLSHKDADPLMTDSAGRTVLSWAAKQGWKEIVQWALHQGFEAEAEDDTGRTALSYAAENGHVDTISILMGYRASPTSQDHARRTPLSYAAFRGHNEAITELIKESDVTVNTRDADGRSLLYFAAEGGRNETVNLLLQEGARWNLHAATKQGVTPLVASLINGHEKTAEWLLQKDAKWDVKIGNEEPWRWAVHHGHWYCAEFLLKKLNENAKEGEKVAICVELRPQTPNAAGNRVALENRWIESLRNLGGLVLTLIESDGQEVTEITMALGTMIVENSLEVKVYEVGSLGEIIYLSHSANDLRILEYAMGDNFQITEHMLEIAARRQPVSRDTGMEKLLSWPGQCPTITTQVVEAAMENTDAALALMELFVEKRGDDVPISATTLQLATEHGDDRLKKLVQCLVERQMTTLLWQALEDDDGEAMTKLLREGARDPNCWSGRGMRPLHEAVLGDKIDVLRVLADCDTVDIDEWDKEGFSALYHAALHKTADVAQILLDAGADPFLNMEDGTNAMEAAERSWNTAVCSLFVKHSAQGEWGEGDDVEDEMDEGEVL